MKFQKGNHFGKGRPTGSGYVEVCQKLAEEAGGWERLFCWAEGKYGAKKNLRIQFESLKLVLAYGYGRPKDNSLTGSPPQDMAERLKAARLRARKATEAEYGH